MRLYFYAPSTRLYVAQAWKTPGMTQTGTGTPIAPRQAPQGAMEGRGPLINGEHLNKLASYGEPIVGSAIENPNLSL